MILDDLKRPWIAEVSAPHNAARMDELLSALARARRDVRMRDAWMILPLFGLAGILLFPSWWMHDTIGLPSLVAVLSIFGCALAVALMLLGARRARAEDGWTLRARLEREIEWLAKQLTLLLTVGYWFLLPMFVAIVVTSTVFQHERNGSYYPSTVLWGLYTAYAAIAVLAAWLCRREANRRFAPLVSRFMELHRDLVGNADKSQ